MANGIDSVTITFGDTTLNIVDEQARTKAQEALAKANELSDQIGNLGGGLTQEQINALDGMFKVVGYIKDDVSAEYEAFKSAFGIESEPVEPEDPEVTLTSISATYTGGEVAVGTALTALTGITVTAHYSDGSTKAVTGYTLSGTIAEGSNTITVSYGGKTTTFTVTGIAESVKVYGVDLTWDVPTLNYGKWSPNGNWFTVHYDADTASIQVGNGFSVNKTYSKPIAGTAFKYFRIPTPASEKQYAMVNNVIFYGCDSPNALTEIGHTITKCTNQHKFVSCDFADDIDTEGMTIVYPTEPFDYYYVQYQLNQSLTSTYPNLVGIFDANILENPLANPTE